MTGRRRIAVLTGTRADWFLLEPLARRLHADPRCEVQLVATAMHLLPEFGDTIATVRASGLPIAAEVPGLLPGDDALSAARSVAFAQGNLAEAFARLRPDLLVVLGDRAEAFSAGVAAFLQRIPLVHLHGGESTEGALDDGLRHALTKLASRHFVATEAYAERLRAMGEPPARVSVAGALGLDRIVGHRPMPRAELLRTLGLVDRSPLVLLTFHPPTLAGETAALAQCRAVVAGVLAAIPGTLVATYPNADAGGRALIAPLTGLAAAHGNAHLCPSLGARYLDVLAHADVMVGNSSSGILEAPSFRLPVVDIGDRQRGRLRQANVISCAPDPAAVADAIRRATASGFRAGLAAMPAAFGDGRAAELIAAALLDEPLPALAKPFNDGPAFLAAAARAGLQR